MADREWESHCGAVAGLSESWYWETDSALCLRYLSGRTRQILGIDPLSLLGNKYTELAGLAVSRFREPVRGLVHEIDTPAGPRLVQVDGDPQFDKNGDFDGYAGIGKVVSLPESTPAGGDNTNRRHEFIESLPLGLVEFDADCRLLSWNSAFVDLYPSLSQFLKNGLAIGRIASHLAENGAITPGDDASGTVFGGKPAVGRPPREVMLANGRWVNVSYHSLPGGGAVGVHIDITRLKQEQEALRQSEQRFARTFQFSPGTTAIAEIEDGTLIDVNEKWQEAFGWTRDEVVGRPIGELNIWVEPTQRGRFIDMLRAHGRVRNFEAQHRIRSGEIRDVLVSGEMVPLDGIQRLLITGHDITERKRAEASLRYSEARLAGILRISPEAVIATDADQNITLFNEGAERIFGYQALEILGRPLDILIPRETRKKHREHVERFRESGESSRTMSARQEISALAKGGRVFPAEASISKLTLQGETIFTVLLHDITERKKAEAMLMTAKEEAESASRAKSEFLANMSHELRTPLNAILGFSEVIRNEVFGPSGRERYVEYANDIHRSGGHLLEVINDILDVARIDSGHVDLDEEPAALRDMADSSLLLVRDRAIAQELKLAVDVPNDLPLLYCDRRRVIQVIVNLLSNAVKFTAPGGRVDLGAWIDAESGDAILEVRDKGIGIAKEDIPRVMEPFVQIAGAMTRGHVGTGLGLPMVSKLTELHGGTVEMESELGAGTTVRISLPANRVLKGDQLKKRGKSGEIGK